MAPNSQPTWRIFSAEEVAENAKRCGSTACAVEEGGKEIHFLACAERIHLKRRVFCIDCIDKHHGGWDELLAALDEPLAADHLRLLESKCSTRGGGGRSRKRKAGELDMLDDETEDEETERSEYIPSLPATCLASVLNFMLYSDVRKCMLVGRIMPNEVAKHVEALTIDTEAGMDVPAARRFPNVKELNICCLSASDQSSWEFLPLAVPKVVPFLSLFRRLEQCFLGGIVGAPDRCVKDPLQEFCEFSNFTASGKHPAILALAEALGGAYSTRLISAKLKFLGLGLGVDERGCEWPRRDNDDQPCRFCRSLCRHFPLEQVVFFESDYQGGGTVCLDRRVMFDIIGERSGAREFLASREVAQLMVDILNEGESYLGMGASDDDFMACVEGRQGVMWLEEEEGRFRDILHLRTHVLKDLEAMVAAGATFDSVKETDVDLFSPPTENDWPSKDIWWHKDIERLLAIGVPINTANILLYDGELDLS